MKCYTFILSRIWIYWSASTAKNLWQHAAAAITIAREDACLCAYGVHAVLELSVCSGKTTDAKWIIPSGATLSAE